MNLRRINGMLLKHWYVTTHSLDRIMDLVFWPLFSLLVWGFTSAYMTTISSRPTLSAMMIGGMMLYVLFQRIQQDVTLYILEDFWSQNLHNLFVTPLTASELVISTLILGFLRAVLGLTALSIVAWLLFSFNILSIGFMSVVLLCANLMLFGWALGMLVTASIFRFGTKIQFFAWGIAFFIQPFCAVFYPLSALPLWVAKVSALLPPTHVFEAMRAILSMRTVPWDSISQAFMLNFMYLLAASLALTLALKHAKQSGIITHH